MTVGEAVKKAANELKSANTDTYNLDAALLVCFVTGFDKLRLITKENNILTPKQEEEFEALLKRRLASEPMQYIMEKAEFMGLDFKVTNDTLIPRADTETVTEKAIEIINNKHYSSCLELCTGSGAVAVSVKKYTEISVTASDISEKALDIARENARTNKTEISFVLSDLFEEISGSYDIIFANPPYIKTKTIPTLSPQVKDYEPILALDGGEDGLVFYRAISKSAGAFLNKGGCLIFEIGYDEADGVFEIMKENGYTDITVFKDLAGLDRGIYGYKVM